ncbi:MAG: hypothetical protein KC546_05810 [Anaerolineae bacterium]|nr:hypothetical protein [Anaerolineae bacterium]MCA9887864.1 hypothetical protein [Anaerolineae bacterium]MCA9893440.1 hypothetical protein [Anaerolineae bacterium]MCB9458261.1 hypothetical protein [Anaerolineaceae bacterium]
MAPLPRILTVDPSGSIAHQVRSAYDLLDRPVIQIDVPTGSAAVEELQRMPCDAIIAAWNCDEHIPGWQLAAEIKKVSQETDVILVAEFADPDLDDETIETSPFIYFRRPMQADSFLRVLDAIVTGDDLFEAQKPPIVTKQVAAAQGTPDYGPVPGINLNNAAGVLDMLLADVNGLAILLATRSGEVLLERGTIGEIDRYDLTHQLLPAVVSSLSLRETVGGNITTLQFYDGQDFDVYVVTVGLHHFLCILFDGDKGSRALGAVSRFGRRTAEDLIALIGAEAWLMIRPEMLEERQAPPPPQRRTRRPATGPLPPIEEIPELEPSNLKTLTQEVEVVEEEPQKVEAIDNLDFDMLFSVSVDGGDDLFDDFDALAELARDEGRKGTLTADQARELGLLDS